MITHDAPLALIGYSSAVSLSLRNLGLFAVSVPLEPLDEVLKAANSLKYSGALIAPELEEAVAELVSLDGDARKLKRVDAVSFFGSMSGTHTLERALLELVEKSGYAIRGAQLMIVGEGPVLRAAVGLARLGVSQLFVVTRSRSEGEKIISSLPAGIRSFVVTLNDSALPNLVERADLIVQAGAALPAAALQPFHTVLDLTSEGVAGAMQVSTESLSALRLGLQLEHAIGKKFSPEMLMSLQFG